MNCTKNHSVDSLLLTHEKRAQLYRDTTHQVTSHTQYSKIKLIKRHHQQFKSKILPWVKRAEKSLKDTHFLAEVEVFSERLDAERLDAIDGLQNDYIKQVSLKFAGSKLDEPNTPLRGAVVPQIVFYRRPASRHIQCRIISNYLTTNAQPLFFNEQEYLGHCHDVHDCDYELHEPIVDNSEVISLLDDFIALILLETRLLAL